jgi:RNA polymerase sigma factor (sigma-70 family)
MTQKYLARAAAAQAQYGWRNTVAETPASVVSDYLRRVAAEEPVDAELLARFSATKDGEAFALLVRRHGPMVLGVCRRGASETADDAFQATFMALARQAGRVRECLPGWLHRVATRISRRCAKRPMSSLPETADAADPFAEVEWKDLRVALDVELAALPSRLRIPLILCYLDGLTRDEAASRLGLSLRTLHRRLDEGRGRLRDRLTRRGLAPVMLGAAALSADGLRAAVSPSLEQRVLDQASGLVTVPAGVQELLTTAAGIRGPIMKSLMALAIAAGGITAVIGVRHPVAADTPPVIQPSELIRTPRPKDPPPETLAEKTSKSKSAAIAWLVKQQNAGGSWATDERPSMMQGGQSALAVVALLESGLKPQNETVKKGLAYLRGIKPQGTYVVSLQTQAFCLANQKEDAEAIKTNVKWLEDTAVRKDSKLIGWSYGSPDAHAADNSNTRYAVAALYAAHKAGFKVQRLELWNDIRTFFLRTQMSNGGWAYTLAGPQATQTMTCSALLCLAQAEDVLGKKHGDVSAAMKRGQVWLGEHIRFRDVQFPYYSLDVLAHAGMTLGSDKLGEGDKGRDWRREGSDWLVKNQRDDGAFQGDHPSENDVISTAFGLRFLHAQATR